ncbi:MAG TPA: DNA polymerase III subunit alpha [Spirochaetota bacterium]|nr:DNA polymerase III subunit alpha [Spirochaetota bacterium]
MSKYNFVHLHNHTDYSLLDGMIQIKKMVSYAKELGMNAVAMTDHGNMYGAIEFYKECKDKGIKPIVGCELYITNDRFDKTARNTSHLILLAKSEKGYKNLIKLSSYGYTEGFYYNPRIDKKLLEQYHEDLICLSACIAGEIPKFILEGKHEEAEKLALYYQSLFGKDSFFFEMQIHGIKEESVVAKNLVTMSKKLQIPVVATNDCHYLKKDDAEAQDILLCIGTKKKFQDPQRMKFHGDGFYFKTEEEMEKIFGELPKALSNTQVIAEMCNLDIKLPGPILPEFEVPQGHTKETYLTEVANIGLKKRYNDITPELQARLDMELKVINDMKFPGYFLIVWDFIHYAKSNDIPVGPGRGSGAGSIVAYSLGITDIEPTRYDLLFERFLNPKRVSMPDFDIDFCQERRQEVIDYVVKKYSKEKVSQIVTFSKMKAKAVIKDVGRVLEIPLSRVNQIVGFLPETFEKDDNLSKIYKRVPELAQIIQTGSDDEKKLLEVSAKLENTTRHTSVHAAGVVIGQKDIIEYVPLQIDKDEKLGDTITTQFEGKNLEECGLVKMDFLGLITLTLIKNCLKLLERKNIKIDINNVPLNDQKVYELFANGEVDAIFQFESAGMKKYLMKLKPTCLEDLIAMNALYRPGPMNFIDDYIKRKHGEPVIYDHPLLEPILKETYGIMVYQEQVMKIAQVLAGYDLGSADILRRAMGKKKKEEMEKQLTAFVEGCKKNNIDIDVANKIFKKMEEFANYGFNKSHAAAYAYLAYQTAYLKAHYPFDFMASVLTSEMGKQEKLLLYLEGIREKGLPLLPPDVNHSFVDFTVNDNKIVYALNGIKGVGVGASESIVNARMKEGKFTDLLHFLKSIDLRLVNHGVMEILIKCGALDSLGQKRKWMLEHLDEYIAEAQDIQQDLKIGQGNLFDLLADDKSHAKTIKPGVEVEEYDDNEKLQLEKETIGFYISGHPLSKYSSYMKQQCNNSSRTIKKLTVNPDAKYAVKIPVTMAGIIDSVKIFKKDDGSNWAVILIEDLYGKFEVCVYKDQYEEYSQLLIPKKTILIKGYCRMFQADKKSIVTEAIYDLEEKQKNNLSEYHIFLKEVETNIDELNNFKNDLNQINGASLSVFFHIKTGEDEEMIIKSMDVKAPKDKEILETFKQKYGFIENIKVM